MNKKRLFGAFLIITSLIVMLLPAAEADAETSASAFTMKGGKLTEYKGESATVSVPDTVTVIGKGAFEDNDYVKKIVLPDSVKKIEAYAFWGCDNLETVVLGEGLTVIDDFAFLNCDGLETMTIPSNIRSIGIQAFADCESFEDITIPPQVLDISEDAFDRDYLLNIHCEAGSYADKYAKGFYERQKNMTMYKDAEEAGEDSVKYVVPEDGVYSGTDSAESDTQDNAENTTGSLFGSTHVVGNQAVVFMQNADLPVQSGDDKNDSGKNADQNADNDRQESDAAGNTVAVSKEGEVVERTYYRNAAVKEAVVEEGVHTIGQFAYARSGLQKITLPEGLEKIEYAAFYHCDDLVEVEIPESVTEVSAKAFAHTAWVDNFLAGADSDSTNAKESDSDDAKVQETSAREDFLISGGVLIAYRGNAEDVVIPEGVRVIAGEAFEDHEEIKTVTLPASLQNIDEVAFEGCSPEKVEYSGSSMDEELVELRVSLNSLTKAPSQSKLPFTWIVAATMLVCGCVFVLRKAK